MCYIGNAQGRCNVAKADGPVRQPSRVPTLSHRSSHHNGGEELVRAVSTSTPSSVTSRLCSNWALLEPSCNARKRQAGPPRGRRADQLLQLARTGDGGARGARRRWAAGARACSRTLVTTVHPSGHMWLWWAPTLSMGSMVKHWPACILPLMGLGW
eukprot:scaffold1328_cov394-Prasinococcus_capsulatus_cf.AAC.53